MQWLANVYSGLAGLFAAQPRAAAPGTVEHHELRASVRREFLEERAKPPEQRDPERVVQLRIQELRLGIEECEVRKGWFGRLPSPPRYRRARPQECHKQRMIALCPSSLFFADSSKHPGGQLSSLAGHCNLLFGWQPRKRAHGCLLRGASKILPHAAAAGARGAERVPGAAPSQACGAVTPGAP